MNHCHYFPYYVTGIVDTFPVYVEMPENTDARLCLYNGKYKYCIYKFMMGMDLLGRIIYFSGPHIGTAYDGHLWNDYGDQLNDWEVLLGDQHFSICNNFITPYRRPAGGNLAYDKLLFNQILSHYRARIEHTNSLIEYHKILQVTFRGELETLTHAAHIIAHTTNIEVCQYLRYEPYGPWSHVPA